MSQRKGTFIWTDERIEQLKQLWAKGLSARKIATELLGDSTKRNSVIGKIHRLGLSGRKNFPAHSSEGSTMPKKPPEKPKGSEIGSPWAWKKNRKKLTQPVPLPEQGQIDLSHAVSIFDHKEEMCRWIICDAVPNIHDLRYCGAKVARGEASYCECHLRMALYRRAA